MNGPESPVNEAALVERARAGDEEAFGELMMTHHQQVIEQRDAGQPGIWQIIYCLSRDAERGVVSGRKQRGGTDRMATQAACFKAAFWGHAQPLNEMGTAVVFDPK